MHDQAMTNLAAQMKQQLKSSPLFTCPGGRAIWESLNDSFENFSWPGGLVPAAAALEQAPQPAQLRAGRPADAACCAPQVLVPGPRYAYTMSL